MALDVNEIRKQFPILSREVNGKPLVYLDNAATTQKPQCVIDSLVHYYSHTNSNVHRGAHRLADEATRDFEQARETIAAFLKATSSKEIIWTAGTTEAINIVAHGIVEHLSSDDCVLVTELEHHANLVTWQQACKKTGARLLIAPINEQGEIELEAYKDLLKNKPKLVAFPQVSNALGTINPASVLCQLAKEVGAWVLVDGAQGVAHGHTDVQAIGCDFYVFSGHKIFGPTGIGVLWGREELLAEWPVWKTGGEMISSVTYQDATWNVLPYRFEAGTPNIAGAVALAKAIEWFSALDVDAVAQHENTLLRQATEQLSQLDGVRMIGTAENKIAVLSFLIEGHHPADIGFLLDQQGVAIRTGHHCAQPLMAKLGIPGTARASFSLYNNEADVVAFITAMKKVHSMLCA